MSSNISQIPITHNVTPLATPSARRRTVNVPLDTPNFKWKYRGDFRPKNLILTHQSYKNILLAKK